MGGAIQVLHNVTPIVGQGDGYYVNIAAILGFYSTLDPAKRTGELRLVHTFMSSALEHGVLEQLQGSENPAVSTIKLLQVSNSLGRWIFSAMYGSWEDVRPLLKNYSQVLLDEIEFYINSIWHHDTYILPEDAIIPLEQWSGLGYIVKRSSGSIGMLIRGGYNGGFAARPGPLAPAVVKKKIPIARPEKRPEVKTPKSKDPVSMTSGDFLNVETDISLGGAEPFGLALTRVYNSSDNDQLQPLGYGWQHNYQMSVQRYSRPDAGLGNRLPIEAAAQIAYIYVALDLMDGFPDDFSTLCAVLATKWAMDQLIDNVLAANIGGQVIEFVRLPDGPTAASILHRVSSFLCARPRTVTFFMTRWGWSTGSTPVARSRAGRIATASAWPLPTTPATACRPSATAWAIP